MTDQAAVGLAGGTTPQARLEPDAIGVAQDTVIGMASSAPAATAAGTLVALNLATAYGGGIILLIFAIPMLIIANAYRRLNLWNANCGASFEWVGRSISPYLGYLIGWFMIAAYVLGTVFEVLVLGPNVLAVFSSNPSTNKWAYIAIGTAIGVIMLVIAVIGIRITARTQVGMAVIEYVILVGLAVAGLWLVLRHHTGTVPITRGWFNPSGVSGTAFGKGSAVAGFLAAIFIYGGWDGTLYVNEEVKHRRVNPGRAAMIAVALLAVIYTLTQVGLQGVVSAKQLNAHSSSAMVYVAGVIGGGFWAKAMAVAIALSVIATTGTGIVLGARIAYGMASYRALPESLANVSRRYKTPAVASIFVGVLIIVVSAFYYLVTSVQGAFNNVISVTSFLFSIFYIFTAIAAMVYYRRRILSSAVEFFVTGLLTLGAAGFLGWVAVKSFMAASTTPAVRWSTVGVIAAGVIMMLIARFGLRSSFFQIRRESDPGPD
jgi:amino acid transporter